MSVRQAINERPLIATAVALIVILAAGLLLWFRQNDRNRPLSEPIANLEFYSDDDGVTFFTDDVKELTPFKHEGKETVRAYVYRCRGVSPFVGYLQRQTEYGRQQRGVAGVTGNRPTVADPAVLEVKKPGDTNPWIPVDPRHFAKVLEVMNVHCPGGSNEGATLIHPAQR